MIFKILDRIHNKKHRDDYKELYILSAMPVSYKEIELDINHKELHD
jgi:hypothetical protein